MDPLGFIVKTLPPDASSSNTHCARNCLPCRRQSTASADDCAKEAAGSICTGGVSMESESDGGVTERYCNGTGSIGGDSGDGLDRVTGVATVDGSVAHSLLVDLAAATASCFLGDGDTIGAGGGGTGDWSTTGVAFAPVGSSGMAAPSSEGGFNGRIFVTGDRMV